MPLFQNAILQKNARIACFMQGDFLIFSQSLHIFNNYFLIFSKKINGLFKTKKAYAFALPSHCVSYAMAML